MYNSTTQNLLGYDTVFGLNSFAKPRLREEAETIKNILLYVLFTKPGQYPSLPDIGLDIQSLLYSFYDEIKESDLIEKITSQCNILGMYFEDGTINIRKIMYRGKPSLMIHVETSEDDLGSQTYLNEEDYKSRFQIGITFDEMNDMIYSISGGVS